MRTKGKILTFAAIAAVVALAGAEVWSSSNEDASSALTLVNVEVLSNEEDNLPCNWSRDRDDFGCVYHECTKNGDGRVCHCGDKW